VASVRYSLRQVLDLSGHILVIQTGPSPDGLGLVTWDSAQDFTVWFTFDSCTWERLGGYQYAAESWWEAQEWAAHRLTFLLAGYQA